MWQTLFKVKKFVRFALKFFTQFCDTLQCCRCIFVNVFSITTFKFVAQPAIHFLLHLYFHSIEYFCGSWIPFTQMHQASRHSYNKWNSAAEFQSPKAAWFSIFRTFRSIFSFDSDENLFQIMTDRTSHGKIQSNTLILCSIDNYKERNPFNLLSVFSDGCVPFKYMLMLKWKLKWRLDLWGYNGPERICFDGFIFKYIYCCVRSGRVCNIQIK